MAGYRGPDFLVGQPQWGLSIVRLDTGDEGKLVIFGRDGNKSESV